MTLKKTSYIVIKVVVFIMYPLFLAQIRFLLESKQKLFSCANFLDCVSDSQRKQNTSKQAMRLLWHNLL